MTRPFRIALAGSHDLPLDRTTRYVTPHVAKAAKVLLRRPKTRTSKPGGFERLCARLAAASGAEVEWVAPEGNDRSQVYLRDLDLVSRADYVVAFLSVPFLDGGTGHVVEAAMMKAIPVEAWYITPDGGAERIGEYDPETDGP